MSDIVGKLSLIVRICGENVEICWKIAESFVSGEKKLTKEKMFFYTKLKATGVCRVKKIIMAYTKV